MIPKLKIFIDPLLKDKYGAEICWIWRLLLTSIGYTWEEVLPEDSECDIAYVSELEKCKNCKLWARAEINYWGKRDDLQLEGFREFEGLSYPLFKGKASPETAFLENDGQVLCLRDIVFDAFWLITGQQEKYLSKNKHGFFDLSDTTIFTSQVLRSALSSRIGSWLEERLLGLGFSSPFPRWPRGKRAAACLSHDVDYPEVKRIVEPLRIIGRQGLSGLGAAVAVLQGKKKHWHFSSWVEMEKKLGLRSAFYFSPAQGSVLKFLFGIPDPFYDVKSQKFRKLFKYLTDEGFEIGLHSSYLAFESEEKFANERQILQQCTGQEIYGNRHHYWHLNPDDIESTLMLHEKIGFKYDSSLIHERYLGWRRGLVWPFFPFHRAERRQLKTLQISPTWMDDQLFGHLKHNPGDRFKNLQAIIELAAEAKGCVVVDIHQYVFDDTLFPDWRQIYLWFMENLIGRSDFWIGTPGEIADHWIKRYSSILDDSVGLREGF